MTALLMCAVLLSISLYQSHACYLVISPVCGSNGQTYKNECFLNSAKGAYPNLTKIHDGACNQTKQETISSCICPFIVLPVCGSDGVTYSNDCLLRCAKRNNPGLTKVSDGECKNVSVALDKVPGVCACTKEYRPICGTDGITYGNNCTFYCQKEVDPDLKKAHRGECKESSAASGTADDDCYCTQEFDPVCGTDGVTYGNKCKLECQIKIQMKTQLIPDLEMAYDGECEQSSIVSDDEIVCTAQWDPVCGTDNRTYGNECELFRQQQINPGLEKAYDGECGKVPGVCACTKEYWPICGSDGLTYGNNCTFYCQKEVDPDLKKAHGGECKESSAASGTADDCYCTLQYAPVCGTDGVTYGNKCQLGCQKRINPGLEMAYDGECQQSSLVSDGGIMCITLWDPVCGTDNRTYGNSCELSRQKRFNPGLEKAYDGECGKPSLVSVAEEACTDEWAPVCGTDNQTYGNICELNLQKKTNPGLEKAYDGDCHQLLTDPGNLPCDCPGYEDEICGSDGNTYGSLCFLQCHQRNDPGLKKESDGPC